MSYTVYKLKKCHAKSEHVTEAVKAKVLAYRSRKYDNDKMTNCIRNFMLIDYPNKNTRSGKYKKSTKIYKTSHRLHRKL